MEQTPSEAAALLIVDVQYDFLPGGALAVPNGDDVLPVVRALLKGKWNFVAASQVGTYNSIYLVFTLPPGAALHLRSSDDLTSVIQPLKHTHTHTQDYHPPGHVSFASTHGKEPFTTLDVPYPYAGKDGAPKTISQLLWPDHCIQGTHGAEIDETVLDALQPWLDAGKGIIVQKGTNPAVDAYSAFASTPGPGVPVPSTSLAASLRAHNISTLYIAGLATDYCVRASALDARSVELGLAH
ncbi:hypothetical protein EW145_g5621, partial [Phellinidium pouzarii]